MAGDCARGASGSRASTAAMATTANRHARKRPAGDVRGSMVRIQLAYTIRRDAGRQIRRSVPESRGYGSLRHPLAAAAVVEACAETTSREYGGGAAAVDL